MNIKTNKAELLCIEVKQKRTDPFIVMAWYRSPKYEHQAIDEIETLLKSPDAEGKEIILMKQDLSQSAQYVPCIPAKAADQVSYSVNYHKHSLIILQQTNLNLLPIRVSLPPDSVIKI